MADEDIVIAVTDDGTIDQLVALLQLLGLTGETAAARIQSGFVNMSSSQKVAEASARAFAAAAEAGYTQTGLLATAMDKLTTAEQAAITNLTNLPGLVNTFALAAEHGEEGAATLAAGMQSLITSSGGYVAAMTEAGEATEGLSRLQIALAGRQEQIDAAYLTSIASSNAYTTALNNQSAALGSTGGAYTDCIAELRAFEAATLAANISIEGLAGTYTGTDNLLQAYNAELAAATARTEAFAAANASLVQATAGLNVEEREAVALLQAFGVTAAEAADRVRNGFAGANAEIGVTSGQFAILSEAEQQGYKETAALATAFGLLSKAELDALSNTAQLDIALTSLNNAAAKAQSLYAAEAAALAEDSGAFTAAASAAEALATAEQRLADIAAADAAAFKEQAQALVTYVGSIEASVDALAGLSGAELKAAEGAAALEKAELEAAAAATTLEARCAAMVEVGGRLGQVFGGLNGIFAGAFATDELIKASDTFTKIAVGLQTVTKNAADFNNVYGQLRDISNSTQTSLEQNAKLYVTLADATRTTGIASSDLIKAVGGIDTALKLGNVTGQEAYRTLRSLSEVFTTTTGSSERFIQNLQRESPATFALVSQAAQKLGIDLKEFGSENDTAAEKSDKLSQKLVDLNNKLGPPTKSAEAYAGAMKTSHSEVDKATQSYNNYVNSLGPGGAKTDAAKAKETELFQAVQKSETAYSVATSAYNSAKAAQDDKTRSTINSTKAELDNVSALATSEKKQKDIIAIAEQIYLTNGEAAKSFTTVSGSITVLTNNLIDFAGKSDASSIAIGALKSVILLAADNLNVIIPLVILFAAGLAVIKTAQLVTDLVLLAKNTAQFALALVTANLETVLFVGAVVIAIAIIQGFINLFLPASQKLDTFGTALDVAKAGAGALGTVVSTLSQKVADNAIHTQATADANSIYAQILAKTGTQATSTAGNLNTLNTAHTTLTPNVTATGQAYNTLNTAAGTATGTTNQLTSATRANNDATGTVKTTTDAYSAAVDTANSKLDDNAKKTTAVNSAQKELNDTTKTSTSLFNDLAVAVVKAVQALVDYAKATANAIGQKLGLTSGSTAPAAHARDGGTFTVPGGTGVDTKTIAVSPGEVVTVQTPAQYHAGVRPPVRAGQTHFATGGVTTGAGVDLGSGVSLSGTAPGAPGSSVTGYDASASTQIASLTTATNANVATTTANTTATTADTSATASNSDTVTANTSALATLTTATGSDASAANDNTGAVNSNTNTSAANTTALGTATTGMGTMTTALNNDVTAANNNTEAANNNTSALNANAQSVVSACNALITSNNNLAQTMASAANAITSAAANIASGASASSNVSASTSSTSSSDDTTTTTPSTSNTSTNASRLAAATADINAGKVNANGTVTGASGKIYQPTYTNQYTSGAFGGKTLTGYDDGYGDKIVLQGGGSTVGNTYSDVVSAQYKAGNAQEASAYQQSSGDITRNLSQYTATLPGGLYKINPNTGASISTADYDEAQQTAANQSAYSSVIGHARDGGDFYVPGGTGVDTKVLAVSPGESVSVRTPAQQNAQQPQGGNNTVNFYVTTPDANSFGNSQSQMSAKLVRGLRRAGRR